MTKLPKIHETLMELRLPWWFLFASMIGFLIMVSGCDPNDYNAQQAFHATRNPAPRLVSGRVALIGCRRDPTPLLRDERGRPLQSTQPTTTALGPSSVKVVNVDTSLAYNYAANRYRQGFPIGRASGVNAFITNARIYGCDDPKDIVFNHAGNLALVACHGSNDVAALSVYPNGETSLIDLYKVTKPIRIAITDQDDAAFVVSEDRSSNNGIAILNLRRVDAFGTPYPRLVGSVRRPLRAFVGNYRIHDIAIGTDLDTHDRAMGYLAVSSNAGGGLVPFDIDVALNEFIPNLRSPVSPAHPASVFEGVTTTPRLYPGMDVNIIALSPSDSVPIAIGSSRSRGLTPFGAVEGYEIAPVPLDQYPGIGGLLLQQSTDYRIDPRQIKDVDFIPNASGGLVLTDRLVATYDTRQEQNLGFRHEPLKLAGQGYERLAVDPEGEFILAVNPKLNLFSILRIDSGQISYEERDDDRLTTNFCIGPQSAAVQPKQLSTLPEPILLQQQQTIQP